MGTISSGGRKGWVSRLIGGYSVGKEGDRPGDSLKLIQPQGVGIPLIVADTPALHMISYL